MILNIQLWGSLSNMNFIGLDYGVFPDLTSFRKEHGFTIIESGVTFSFEKQIVFIGLLRLQIRKKQKLSLLPNGKRCGK